MIWLVAKPLLESASDYESKKMILNLTALAWNFTLLDATAQKEMLARIADLFPCPEGMEMFLYLADRTDASLPRKGPRHLQGRNGARTVRRCHGASCVGDVRVCTAC
jgi:hypothetical protein